MTTKTQSLDELETQLKLIRLYLCCGDWQLHLEINGTWESVLSGSAHWDSEHNSWDRPNEEDYEWATKLAQDKINRKKKLAAEISGVLNEE
jgi:hypothetical protein